MGSTGIRPRRNVTSGLTSLFLVHRTILEKSLNFRTLSFLEITSVTVSGIVGIVAAYTGFGVWSLALKTLVHSLTMAITTWTTSDWRPSFTFSRAATSELIGFSSNRLGTKSVEYWTRSIDKLLIGRFLGSSPLGAYSLAYLVMLFPLASVADVLKRVMFPSFSILQNEPERVKRLYLKLTRLVALVTFPMMLGLLVVVEPFVLAVFGTEWTLMIPILQILCLVGMLQSIGGIVSSLYTSQGRADLELRVGLVINANLILGIVVGLRWGIVGVAAGYAIASLINFYPEFFFAGRLVNLSCTELLKNLAGIFVCAVAMAALVWSVHQAVPSDWSPWPQLAILIPTGIATYPLFLHVFRLTAYREARDILQEQLHNLFHRPAEPTFHVHQR